MDDIILKADSLYFSYDNERTPSLNGLSLEIRRGKKIALMGANGSGKSTFFLCCNGILKPDSGTLYFNNRPFDYSRKGLLALRSRIGIVFQDPDDQLFAASVYQELSFGLLNLGFSPEEARRKVDDAIADLDMGSFAERPTYALSGGQKKQVAIADITIMNPDIIILDEPASALDPLHTKKVSQIVAKLSGQGTTILMATHDVNYALNWADEIILFKDGTVCRHGTPEEVFTDTEALCATNLEMPAALELFYSLCRKGILDSTLPLPRNLKTLEYYIEKESHLCPRQ